MQYTEGRCNFDGETQRPVATTRSFNGFTLQITERFRRGHPWRSVMVRAPYSHIWRNTDGGIISYAAQITYVGWWRVFRTCSCPHWKPRSFNHLCLWIWSHLGNNEILWNKEPNFFCAAARIFSFFRWKVISSKWLTWASHWSSNCIQVQVQILIPLACPKALWVRVRFTIIVRHSNYLGRWAIHNLA